MSQKGPEIRKEDSPLKVLVVDDSPMMCRVIEEILLEDGQVGHVDRALNGREAISRIASDSYDVCTLDVHMPGMNGLSVLKNIMVRTPVPTLMVSAFTGDGSRVTFEALRYGAVDFFKKPSRNGDEDLLEQAETLRQRVRRAARVQVRAARYLRLKPRSKSGTVAGEPGLFSQLVVICAGTGGYSSLLSLIPALSGSAAAPIVISLTTPPQYLNAFVDYLASYSSIPLKRAESVQVLQPGTAYFLASDEAASFEQAGGKWEMAVEARPIDAENEGPVDLILLSASEHFGNGLLSIFLSGDSPYGVTGAEEVKRNGGTVLVQEPAECLSPMTPDLLRQQVEAEALECSALRTAVEKWGAEA
jgi:two-component system chemotaxis response regulator CheB